jgi:hypothetical protein
MTDGRIEEAPGDFETLRASNLRVPRRLGILVERRKHGCRLARLALPHRAALKGKVLRIDCDAA